MSAALWGVPGLLARAGRAQPRGSPAPSHTRLGIGNAPTETGLLPLHKHGRGHALEAVPRAGCSPCQGEVYVYFLLNKILNSWPSACPNCLRAFCAREKHSWTSSKGRAAHGFRWQPLAHPRSPAEKGNNHGSTPGCAVRAGAGGQPHGPALAHLEGAAPADVWPNSAP